MRTRFVTTIVAAVFAAIGCSRQPAPEERAAPSGVFEALGDQGTVLVAAWPQHWQGIDALRTALADALPPLREPRMVAALDELRTHVSTPWSALRAMAGVLRLPEVPESPPGMDTSRPLLAAILIPTTTAEEGAASIAAAVTERKFVASGIRHRVVIPASDPAALAGALDAALGSLAPLDGIAGGRGDENRMVRIARGESWVTVDLVLGYGLTTLDKAGRERLLGPDVREAAVHHPLFASSGASAARVHIRLDRLAEAGSSASMIAVANAMASIGDLSTPATLLMQATSEVLSGVLLLDRRHQIVTDAIADLPASTPVAPVLYLVASEAGREALRADGKLAAGSAVPPGELDLPAIASAAKPPPILAAARSPSEAAELVHECGYSCTIYLALGNGLAVLGAVERTRPGWIATEIRPAIAASGAFPRGRISLAGSVLVIEPIGPSEGAAARAKEVEPRPTPSSKAADCYARALTELRGHLRAGAPDEGRKAGEALDRFDAAARADLECAADAPELAPRVAKLRELIASLRKSIR